MSKIIQFWGKGEGERIRIKDKPPSQEEWGEDKSTYITRIVPIAVHQMYLYSIIQQVREILEVPAPCNVTMQGKSTADGRGDPREVERYAEGALYPLLVEIAHAVVRGERVLPRVRHVEPAVFPIVLVRLDEDALGISGDAAAVLLDVARVNNLFRVLEGLVKTLTFVQPREDAVRPVKFFQLLLFGGLVDGDEAIRIVPAEDGVEFGLYPIVYAPVDDPQGV